ncbi:hypothetical protein FRB91_002038 [Serendipita sp. 411]|nr:hypothetical protein FRB91_002038 [Serendipita sp. 411]
MGQPFTTEATRKQERNEPSAGWERRGSVGLGTKAEVYDPEITALLRGLEGAIDYLQNSLKYRNSKQTSIYLSLTTPLQLDSFL